MSGPFGDNARKYWEVGHSVIPLDGKAPIPAKWPAHINGPPKFETRQEWLEKFPGANLGYLTGSPLDSQFRSVVIDVDDDALVRVAKAIIGPTPCEKIGKKGCSLFAKFRKA